jgi:hypothetical protein
MSEKNEDGFYHRPTFAVQSWQMQAPYRHMEYVLRTIPRNGWYVTQKWERGAWRDLPITWDDPVC